MARVGRAQRARPDTHACGIRASNGRPAGQLNGKDPDFHRRDLWNAIETGALVPVRRIGRMTLNRNPQNELFDALYVPGGKASCATLLANADAIHFLREAFKHCKALAASGDGVKLLAALNLPRVSLASAAGSTESSGVVTATALSGAADFAELFASAIAKHRHWDRDVDAVSA